MEDYLRSNKQQVSAQNSDKESYESKSDKKLVEKAEIVQIDYKDALNNT